MCLNKLEKEYKRFASYKVMTDSILYDRMVTFVLSEVDYAVENGYSRRARRFMRRSLAKELKEINDYDIAQLCEEKEYSSDEDPLDLSINIYKYKTPAYISAIYVGMLFAFYIWASQGLYIMIINNTNQTDNMD